MRNILFNHLLLVAALIYKIPLKLNKKDLSELKCIHPYLLLQTKLTVNNTAGIGVKLSTWIIPMKSGRCLFCAPTKNNLKIA